MATRLTFGSKEEVRNCVAQHPALVRNWKEQGIPGAVACAAGRSLHDTSVTPEFLRREAERIVQELRTSKGYIGQAQRGGRDPSQVGTAAVISLYAALRDCAQK
jgi:hypothetical protein